MRSLGRVCVAIAVGAAGGACTGPPDLRIMTFNIRYGTARDGPDAWPLRRAAVLATVREAVPTLLGVQEALHFQVGELEAALPRLRRLGVGREDGDTAGEYAALFVDTTRFAVLDHGTFWLSDTPDVPNSMHWGNRITRICTWARLADRLGRDTVRVYDTHWDHESQPARELSATLILERIAAGPPDDGVILMGDFNAGEDNGAFTMLVTGTDLRDTYRALYPSAAVVGTFNGFTGDSTGPKIDAVLVSHRFVPVAASIDRRAHGGRYASDHFPVTARVRWRSR